MTLEGTEHWIFEGGLEAVRREREGTSLASLLGETSPTHGVSQSGHRKKTLFDILLKFFVYWFDLKKIYLNNFSRLSGINN